ncbi:replication endonuclease [Burkholderia pseudomallei]|uniref:replication endonuclease n=1 Tax=Burkholderia pseudomallei TaxID=28450 RepID=UPI001594167E|nr:replication endonuclease [Burkholderia pseudomallei]NVH64817.1 replication endonuclease [Burkholderia pseudomallei]
MWIYAYDVADFLPGIPEAKAAAKRLPARWYRRALSHAEAAGHASAVKFARPDQQVADRMFDVSEAARAIREFLDEHAPDSFPVRPDANDFEICLKARRIANDVSLRSHGLSILDAHIVAENACAMYGVDLPNFEHPAERVARVRCELWWRRQLRKKHIRALEHSNIRLHYVHRKAEPYASDDAVRRRVAQNRRNDRTLKSVTVENENGQQFTLAELAAKGISNKALKRGELFTRLRGLEELADDAKLRGVMFTLTCPSRFHCVRTTGGVVEPNPVYADASPREAQAYLRKVWQRIRAELKREGIVFFGMRVAEPHHDGCPHWHGLVFSDKVERFCAVMRKHGLRDSGDEPGAQLHRVRFEVIDKAKGSAVGYVAKYISKNIDGYAVGEHKTNDGYVIQADMWDGDEITPSQRVEAWAALWGIRQFQQFGGAPVGVWRELRRVKEEDLPSEAESPQIRAAWAAAQKTDERPADWAAYSRAMGGIAGETRMVYVRYTIEQREGRYGIGPVRVPHGVEALGVAHIVDGLCPYSRETKIFVPSTRHEWRVVRRGGGAARPWTRVNNCTRDDRPGVAEIPAEAVRIGANGVGNGAKRGHRNL